MIISKNYALRLIRQGKAAKGGTTTDSVGNRYIVLDRYDLARTDHYYED